MKIYFAGSIRGGRQDKDLYLQLIKYLEKYGDVLTEHVGNSNLTCKGEQLPLNEIYARDVSWLKDADVIVAEVTTPSLGVGYELGLAESLHKTVLCLFRTGEDKTKTVSPMIGGNSSFTNKNYITLNDAFKEIDIFLMTLKKIYK
jgi:nucleoside 2-deoxyribosyltransferase